MDIEKVIERTIAELNDKIVYAPQRGYFISDVSAKHKLRAAFDAVRREAINDAMRHVCRLCSDGDEPKRGIHDVVVGRVPCHGYPLRQLLPPAAEETVE